jgi:hypothetical protein
MTRRGFTLAEMLTSLLVTSAVIGFATHAIMGQLRFLSGVAAVAGVRAELSDVAGIVQSLVWAASPSDITVAQDSVLELRAPIGVAVVCDGGMGTITIPAPSPLTDNAVSGFSQMPDVGDRVAALLDDSLGGTWLTFDLASAPESSTGCAKFGGPAAWRLVAQQPLDLSAARAIHVLRPFRASLYKASDGRWYLGGRDWNSVSARFNSIQPIAGPLLPYNRNPLLSGLVFTFADSTGAPIESPADPARVSAITIVVRAETRAPVRGTGMATTASGVVRDSLALTVSLRNRP